MGYNKIIVSGPLIETYEYEKNIHPYIRPRTRASSDVSSEVLDSDRANPLSERVLGKRRDNAKRAQNDFGRLVRANLDGVVRPLLLTITYAQNQEDLAAAFGDFTAFIEALRYRYGKGFKYIAVPEFQKRGAVHFHALFWGLSEALLFRERKTRELAQAWGRGFIYIKPTDGNEKLSWYLAKYMSKAYLDPRLAGCKAYVASRNVSRPRVMSGISPLWPLLDDLGLSPSNMLHEKRFMTYWLGRAVYRRYQLKQN